MGLYNSEFSFDNEVKSLLSICLQPVVVLFTMHNGLTKLSLPNNVLE